MLKKYQKGKFTSSTATFNKKINFWFFKSLYKYVSNLWDISRFVLDNFKWNYGGKKNLQMHKTIFQRVSSKCKNRKSANPPFEKTSPLHHTSTPFFNFSEYPPLRLPFRDHYNLLFPLLKRSWVQTMINTTNSRYKT